MRRAGLKRRTFEQWLSTSKRTLGGLAAFPAFVVCAAFFVTADATFAATSETRAGENDRLRVQLCDTTGLAPDTLRRVQREASLVFSWAGVDLAWFPKCPFLGERGIVHVYIFREFSQSRLSELELNVAERPVMGYSR